MRKYRFIRSKHKIEIDITWQCNLTCFDCNRCCGTAPTGEKMTISQIEKFIKESESENYKWKVIRVIGGEPTIHPNFLEIIQLLINYRNTYEKDEKFKLIVSTNGYSQKTKQLLNELPNEVIIENSHKELNEIYHIGHFNVAPIDIRDTSNEDFTIACTNATYCGMGLTPNGYYHCPVAGSIDRVFGFDLGKKSLPKKNNEMHDSMNAFCKYCGFFDTCDKKIVPVEDNVQLMKSKPPITKSWEEAYKILKTKGKHKLTPY
jgi:sulfatase maturation enzyme AslB (radical SAM superfamily)